MPQPTISVIFPVHNEAKILAKQIGSFLRQSKQTKLKILEVILVENGSSDHSWEIIQTLHYRHRFIKPIRLPHASYGQALKAGLITARGSIIFIFNVDFFDVNFITQALPLLKSADIVVGSKTLFASQDLRSHFRRLTTYLFNILLRLILNYPGTDTHGIKALKNTPLLRYCIHRSRTKNELFDTELIIRAHRWSAVLTELPITVREIRPTRYSWLRRIRLTLSDLAIAFWSKYLIPNFSKRIVTGDDYGRSPEINQAIISAAQSGVVQIISILPNKISLSQVKRLHHLKSVGFSAHLNLIEGKPVSSSIQVPSLINQTGHFWPLPQFLLRLFLGLINLSEVRLELTNQIHRLRDLNLKLDHLDSHRHIHLFPPIWNTVIKLAKIHHISHIRSHNSIRQALKSHPEKYLLHWPIFWALSLRYGNNRPSSKELDEIVIHPGAAYYD
jgi:predicted glycoside hydrolase/deacetylase ChbG (UPF0249 family)